MHFRSFPLKIGHITVLGFYMFCCKTVLDCIIFRFSTAQTDLLLKTTSPRNWCTYKINNKSCDTETGVIVTCIRSITVYLEISNNCFICFFTWIIWSSNHTYKAVDWLPCWRTINWSCPISISKTTFIV